MFFGEENEGSIVSIEGVLVVKEDAFLLGSSIEETVGFIWIELQLWLQ